MISLSSKLVLATLTVVTLSISGRAQSAGSSTRLDQWDRLRKAEHQSVDAAQAGGPGRGQAAAATFLSRANELRDFRLADASDPKSKEARRLEALMLLYAERYGDKTNRSRCDEAVREVRADISLPVGQRFAIASMADHREVLANTYAHDDERLARLEEIARALLREFPTAPQAYEALLYLADCCREKQAVRLARDLLKMDAPAGIKIGAQVILDRHALVGQSLTGILQEEIGAEAAAFSAGGKTIILYAWATWNEGCLEAARLIAAQAPPGATIIGVNLDTDLTQAKQIATARNLPGTLLYDPAGLASKLARRLRLTGKDDIYIASQQGQIRTVTARLDYAAELSAANN